MKFRKEENKDWWDAISAEEKASIKKGIEDADNKHLSPHSTARKIYENVNPIIWRCSAPKYSTNTKLSLN